VGGRGLEKERDDTMSSTKEKRLKRPKNRRKKKKKKKEFPESYNNLITL